jgi:hypothetical protein
MGRLGGRHFPKMADFSQKQGGSLCAGIVLNFGPLGALAPLPTPLGVLQCSVVEQQFWTRENCSVVLPHYSFYGSIAYESCNIVLCDNATLNVSKTSTTLQNENSNTLQF